MTPELKNEYVTFFDDIENHMASSNISIMDAVLHWAEKRGLEIEYVASIISKNPKMKSLLQCEAEELNFIRKTERVPI